MNAEKCLLGKGLDGGKWFDDIQFGEDGYIHISIDNISQNKAKLVISAKEEISIMRAELEG